MNRRQRVGRKSASVVIAVFLALLVLSIPVVEAAALNLTYDANGNLVTDDGKFRTYNDLNQLTKLYNGSNASGNARCK